MAQYNGTAVDVLATPKIINGILLNGDIELYLQRWYLDNERCYSGAWSLCIRPGGVFDLNYGCDAGSKTISMKVWAPATGHKVAAKVIDPNTRDAVASGSPAGAGAWETLNLNFTAEKKVYVLRLLNSTPAAGDKRAWFDEIF